MHTVHRFAVTDHLDLVCFRDSDPFIHICLLSSSRLFLLCCIQRHLSVEYLFVYMVNYYVSCCCHCYL